VKPVASVSPEWSCFFLEKADKDSIFFANFQIILQKICKYSYFFVILQAKSQNVP